MTASPDAGWVWAGELPLGHHQAATRGRFGQPGVQGRPARPRPPLGVQLAHSVAGNSVSAAGNAAGCVRLLAPPPGTGRGGELSQVGPGPRRPTAGGVPHTGLARGRCARTRSPCITARRTPGLRGRRPARRGRTRDGQRPSAWPADLGDQRCGKPGRPAESRNTHQVTSFPVNQPAASSALRHPRRSDAHRRPKSWRPMHARESWRPPRSAPVTQHPGRRRVPAPMRAEVHPRPLAQPAHQVIDRRVRKRPAARPGEQVDKHVIRIQVPIFTVHVVAIEADQPGTDRNGALLR